MNNSELTEIKKKMNYHKSSQSFHNFKPDVIIAANEHNSMYCKYQKNKGKCSDSNKDNSIMITVNLKAYILKTVLRESVFSNPFSQFV